MFAIFAPYYPPLILHPSAENFFFAVIPAFISICLSDLLSLISFAFTDVGKKLFPGTGQRISGCTKEENDTDCLTNH